MALVTNVVHGSDADRVLLLLHGYGADERDLGGLLGVPRPRGPLRHRAAAWAAGRAAGLLVVRRDGGDPTPARGVRRRRCAVVDDLLDEVCAEHGLSRGEAVVGGFSQGGGLALALGLGRSDRPHPAGVLAMSPFVRAERRSTSTGRRRADIAGAPPARHRRPDDPGRPAAASWPQVLVEHGRAASSTASTRWATRSRSRACSRRRPGSTRCAPASSRRSRCPSRRPRARCKPVTTATFDDRGAAERRAR